jgi:FtsZ-binding cell division protein ZapB
MNDLKVQDNDRTVTVEDLVALVERAARTIERLQTEVAVQGERIKQLEHSEAVAKHAAERFLRMKAQLESLPAATGGFSAHGATYASFEEAFDAAYPVQQAA